MKPISLDWYEQPIDPAPEFWLAQDPNYLWFVAQHERPASTHPSAKKSEFFEGLWEYDLVELFIGAEDPNAYLEFNLSMNGAWWACDFSAPRIRKSATPLSILGVRTYSEHSDSGAWRCGMAIPLEQLQDRIGFSNQTRINVTMILESPRSRFFSSYKLGNGPPDFHQPCHFSKYTQANLAFHS